MSAGVDLVLRLTERGIEHHMDRAPGGGRVRLWLMLADAQRLADALAPAPTELPEAVLEILRTVAGVDPDTALPCGMATIRHSSPRHGCSCWSCMLALEARAALGGLS